MSDDDEQEGSGSQDEQGDSGTSGGDESEGSDSSGGSKLDRPTDIIEDVRGGDQQDSERR